MRIWNRATAWAAITLMATSLASSPSAAEPPAARPPPGPASKPGRPARARRAQAKSAFPPGYTQAIEEAFREFELGNYAEARSRFLQANELFPSAPTLRALGMVEFELRNYENSVAYLEQALQSVERPLGPDTRAATEQLLADARGYLVQYVVSVRPPSATLLLDGQPLVLGLEGAVTLRVGDHLLEAHAPGYHPARRVLHALHGTSQNKLDIVLLAAEPPHAPVASAPLYRNWWLWTGVGGAVLAGTITGIALAARRPDPAEPSGGTEGTVLYVPSK